MGESIELTGYDETERHVVLALACVEALRRVPTQEMWEFIWSLAWHSGMLASFLPEAVVDASTDAKFREAFLAIGHTVVEHAARNPGRRAILRERDYRANMREQWRKRPRAFSTLWRGNFRFDPIGGDDDHVLSIIVELDATEFVELLKVFDHPEPVAQALISGGASWKFERWRALVSPAHSGLRGKRAMERISDPAAPAIDRTGPIPIQVGPKLDGKPGFTEATAETRRLAAEIARSPRPAP